MPDLASRVAEALADECRYPCAAYGLLPDLAAAWQAAERKVEAGQQCAEAIRRHLELYPEDRSEYLDASLDRWEEASRE